MPSTNSKWNHHSIIIIGQTINRSPNTRNNSNWQNKETKSYNSRPLNNGRCQSLHEVGVWDGEKLAEKLASPFDSIECKWQQHGIVRTACPVSEFNSDTGTERRLSKHSSSCWWRYRRWQPPVHPWHRGQWRLSSCYSSDVLRFLWVIFDRWGYALLQRVLRSHPWDT